VLEIERQSVENAFEDWSEKGNRRSLSSEESKLTFRKEPFSQIAGRSLDEKELETQFNEEDKRGGKSTAEHERTFNGFPSCLPSFPLPTIYKENTERARTLGTHLLRWCSLFFFIYF
jgi:hypothetical protein